VRADQASIPETELAGVDVEVCVGALTLSYRRITIPDLERFAKDHGTLIDSGLAVPSYGNGAYAG
jgi:hypothetical protein